MYRALVFIFFYFCFVCTQNAPPKPSHPDLPEDLLSSPKCQGEKRSGVCLTQSECTARSGLAVESNCVASVCCTGLGSTVLYLDEDFSNGAVIDQWKVRDESGTSNWHVSV